MSRYPYNGQKFSRHRKIKRNHSSGCKKPSRLSESSCLLTPSQLQALFAQRISIINNASNWLVEFSGACISTRTGNNHCNTFIVRQKMFASTLKCSRVSVDDWSSKSVFSHFSVNEFISSLFDVERNEVWSEESEVCCVVK